MPTWPTHLALADRLFKTGMTLDPRGFAVGSVGPDCNVENEGWTEFTPSRESTHCTRGRRKAISDAEEFYRERVEGKRFSSGEERSFFFGYYAHILVDALYQDFTHRPEEVEESFGRLDRDPAFRERRGSRPKDFDTLKELFGPRFTYREIEHLEGLYLREHPDSLFLTVLRHVHSFPDYMPEFPSGAFSRKIALMAYLPDPGAGEEIFWTGEKYSRFLEEAFLLLYRNLREKGIAFSPHAESLSQTP